MEGALLLTGKIIITRDSVKHSFQNTRCNIYKGIYVPDFHKIVLDCLKAKNIHFPDPSWTLIPRAFKTLYTGIIYRDCLKDHFPI